MTEDMKNKYESMFPGPNAMEAVDRFMEAFDKQVCVGFLTCTLLHYLNIMSRSCTEEAQILLLTKMASRLW